MNIIGNTGYGVRVFHAANINEPVNIYFDDREVIRRLNYREVSDYINLPNNRYNIKIYGANSGRLLYNQTVNIDSNKFITLSAISQNGRLDLIVLEDFSANQRYRTNKRNIKKKIVAGFNNLIDVIVNETGEIIQDVEDQFGEIIVRTGDRIIKIIDRLGNVVEAVINSAGEIIALVFDELSDVVENVIIRTGDVVQKTVDDFGNAVDAVLDEFDEVVGWVIGDVNQEEDYKDNLSTLIPQTNRFTDNRAFIRVIHLSPNAPAIDTTLPDDTILFVDTKFKQVTDYKRIGAGLNTLQLRPTGTNTIVLTIPNLNLMPNNHYTLYVIGNLGGTPPLEAVLLRDGR